ncbi:MAG: hypothetical protein DMG72_10670 [Acidobacteria bacterium]|nr:MAG: hypothetical protein DMG72_10670 [Acidobacteriota bacterium]
MDTNNTNVLHERAARAYIVAGCFKMGLAKTMIMRKIDVAASGSPNPSGLDVGASVSLVPSSAYP